VIRFRALAVLLLVVAGCSGGPVVLSPDGDYFDGLDPALVAEVLGNPTSKWVIGSFEGEEQEQVAQGSVVNYGYCREMLRVYQEWTITGVRPELEPPRMPDSPRGDLAYWWGLTRAEAEDLLASGDIEQWRLGLANPNGNCAHVPAKPGDISGPTIAEVVKGAG